MMKGKERNYQKGITLIALVITIIVLLILAGVTINIAIKSGIMEKSEQAVNKYTEEQTKEKLRLAIVDYKMGKIMGDKKNFEIYIKDIGGDATHNEDEGTYTVELDGYKFIVDEEDIEGTTSYKAYSIGDTVTVGGEQFYVLEDSDATKDTVTLIAKYNLNTAGTAQAPNAAYEDTACAFCSNETYTALGSFTEGENLNDNTTVKEDTTSAVYKAKAYAKTVTGDNTNNTGRLLTYNEATTLQTAISTDETGKIATMLWGQENTQSNGNYLVYWLSSAHSTSSVWRVYGNFNGSSFGDGNYYGVRPVITISKSSVS